MILTRDGVLAADDLKRELVEVPEWSGTVYVRMMTAGERQEYVRQTVKTSGGKIEVSEACAEAALVAMTVCGIDGKLLFTTADVAALAGKSASAIGRIARAAAALNEIIGGARKTLAKN